MIGPYLLIGNFGVGPTEMLLLMFVALLLYGGELPKVARSWGKSLAEFKKGMSGIQNEFNSALYDEPRRIPYHDPVYSHNAGTIDGHLAEVNSTDADHPDRTLAPSMEATSLETAHQATAADATTTERQST
ncbi:MAG: twin-arginine translocase TatA/TatE family subunit [Bythopirellula sp.]|nr:twin-arginine translocase TatA/TatE family subunit [Bythopirellula sp.]